MPVPAILIDQYVWKGYLFLGIGEEVVGILL